MTIRIDGTNTAANPGITGSDTDTGLQFGTNEVKIVTGGSTRSTVDSSGRLLVGTSTARSNVELYNSNRTPTLQVETATGTSDNGIALVNNNGSGWEPFLTLGTSGGSSTGSNTLVANNTAVGSIAFSGNDGDQFVELARITGFVDGTPGSDDMPGRLSFLTTADGAATPTERMRLTSTGDLRFNSGYGSVATAYGVRAWVNFQGTGTVAKREDGNISSVTDNATGDYSLSFSTALVDANYSVVASCGTSANGNPPGVVSLFRINSSGNHVTPTTSGFRITTSSTGGSAQDAKWVCVAVIR